VTQGPEPEPLNHVLGQVSRLHHARSHSLLEQIGLYRGQPPVLHALWHQEGLTHTDLAKQLHVQPATITKMIKRMEQAGFVVRQRDTEDERVSRVYLTARGREIRADLERVQDTIEAHTFAGFSSDERELVRQLLVRMRHNLAQMSSGRGGD